MTFKEMIKDPGPGLSFIAGFLTASSIVGLVIFLEFRYDIHETHIQTLALVITGMVTTGGVLHTVRSANRDVVFQVENAREDTIYQVESADRLKEEERQTLTKEKAMGLYAAISKIHRSTNRYAIHFKENQTSNPIERIVLISALVDSIPTDTVFWRNDPSLIFGLNEKIVRIALTVDHGFHNLGVGAKYLKQYNDRKPKKQKIEFTPQMINDIDGVEQQIFRMNDNLREVLQVISKHYQFQPF